MRVSPGVTVPAKRTVVGKTKLLAWFFLLLMSVICGEGDQGLTFDVLECAVCVVDVLAGNTEEAEAVENRKLESTHFGEVRVDMEGIVVAAETV